MWTSWSLKGTLLCLALAAGCAPRAAKPVGPASAASLSRSVPSAQRGSDTLLEVAQDDLQTEQRIADYLIKQGHSVTVAPVEGSEKPGRMLTMSMRSDVAPSFRVFLRTKPSSEAEGTVTERVVLLYLSSTIKLPPEQWPAALDTINKHHNESWAGTFYVDRQDGELMGFWQINIVGTHAIHPEMVRDAWMHLCSAWEDLYQEMKQDKSLTLKPSV